MSKPLKTNTREFVLKSYSRKELQFMYEIPVRTFRRWLAPYRESWGLKRYKYFSIEQVSKIIEVYGVPHPTNLRPFETVSDS